MSIIKLRRPIIIPEPGSPKRVFFSLCPFNPFKSNYFISQRILAEEATLVLLGAASIHWGSLPYLMRVSQIDPSPCWSLIVTLCIEGSALTVAASRKRNVGGEVHPVLLKKTSSSLPCVPTRRRATNGTSNPPFARYWRRFDSVCQRLTALHSINHSQGNVWCTRLIFF